MLAVVLTVIVRALGLLLSPAAFQDDPDAYQAIATTIDSFGVFGLTSPAGEPRPIAFRPPLYPWLLSICISDGQLSGVAVGMLHVALSALTAMCAFLATRQFVAQIDRVGEGRIGEIAGLLVTGLIAIDPILFRQSSEVMTETLAATLATAVIWSWSKWTCGKASSDRRNAVTLGILLALAYLCRPTFLVWAVLLMIAVLLGRRGRRGVVSGLLVTAIVAIAVGGWTIRNQRLLGHPVWATTHGGYTLLLANNESFYRYLSEGQFGQAWDAGPFLNAYQHRYEGDPREADFWEQDWTGEPNYDGAGSEYEDDRLCYESAVATIKRQPGVFLWSTVVRVARLWSPFPHDVAGRSRIAVFAVGAFYILIAVAVVVAIVRHRRRLFAYQLLAIWLLVFALTGVHAVYWSNLRMRAPAMPALAMIAVMSMVRERQSVDQKVDQKDEH